MQRFSLERLMIAGLAVVLAGLPALVSQTALMPQSWLPVFNLAPQASAPTRTVTPRAAPVVEKAALHGQGRIILN